MVRVEIIGGLAAFTSTISLLPQITKVLSTRSTDDLSFWMLLNFLITSVLWVWYGVMIDSFAVWSCNLFMIVTAVMLLVLKRRFG